MEIALTEYTEGKFLAVVENNTIYHLMFAKGRSPHLVKTTPSNRSIPDSNDSTQYYGKLSSAEYTVKEQVNGQEQEAVTKETPNWIISLGTLVNEATSFYPRLAQQYNRLNNGYLKSLSTKLDGETYGVDDVESFRFSNQGLLEKLRDNPHSQDGSNGYTPEELDEFVQFIEGKVNRAVFNASEPEKLFIEKFITVQTSKISGLGAGDTMDVLFKNSSYEKPKELLNKLNNVFASYSSSALLMLKKYYVFAENNIGQKFNPDIKDEKWLKELKEHGLTPLDSTTNPEQEVIEKLIECAEKIYVKSMAFTAATNEIEKFCGVSNPELVKPNVKDAVNKAEIESKESLEKLRESAKNVEVTETSPAQAIEQASRGFS